MKHSFLCVSFLVVLADAFFIKSSHMSALKSSELSARRKGKKSGGKAKEAQYFELEPDGSDAWRADQVVDTLRQGGVGVLPTDTCYSFVTSINSKEGVERILRIKGNENCKKPLSLMCADLASIDKYTFGVDKQTFKILKKNLPGPYTFILPASSELPKLFFFNRKGKMKTSKRATVGCRIPKDEVALSVLHQLDAPLLVSSVPAVGPSEEEDDGWGSEEDEEEEEEWEDENSDEAAERRRARELAAWTEPSNPDDAVDCLQASGTQWPKAVDFIVDCGPRPVGGSTIFDLSTAGDPVLLRAGRGGESIKY